MRSQPINSRAIVILLATGSLVILFIVDGFFKASLYSASQSMYWVFDCLKFVAIPAVLLYFLARKYNVTPSRYGLNGIAANESPAHFLGLLIFLVIVLNLVYYFTVYASWLVFRPEPIEPFSQMIIPKGILHFPVVLYMSVTAGVVEEIFFRGLPLLYLRERFPNSLPQSGYLLVTASLFAIAHWENGPHEIVGTFFYGLFSGIIYLKLKDLWPFVCTHTLVDVWDFA